MKMFDLSGRVALVTGGNGGIGLGLAKGLMESGARVVIAGRDEDKLKSSANVLGERAIPLQLNIADAGACQDAIDSIAHRFGRLDILVNNAGLNVRATPENVEEADWDRMFAVNLKAAFHCCQFAFSAMKRQGGGKIINISSMGIRFGSPFVAPYLATKAGLEQVTKSLAHAWAPHNIQANAILPGWIETEMLDGARARIEGLGERALARTPAGRLGRPADLVGACIFFASGASDFVTGTSLIVDGGYSLNG